MNLKITERKSIVHDTRVGFFFIAKTINSVAIFVTDLKDNCITGFTCIFVDYNRWTITMVHFIWPVMTKKLFLLWSCQSVCDALSHLLGDIYIRFGTKLYRQIVIIPMGTNCASLVPDLFLYCYERDFMNSLNHDNQADVIEVFN